jgi:hypothetical protein
MTNRERWIIYPLLFMALGYGWKANVMQPQELGPSPLAIHVIDQNNRKHMIGGLFRHPPKETSKAEPKKNEKPSGEEAAGK